MRVIRLFSKFNGSCLFFCRIFNRISLFSLLRLRNITALFLFFSTTGGKCCTYEECYKNCDYFFHSTSPQIFISNESIFFC